MGQQNYGLRVPGELLAWNDAKEADSLVDRLASRAKDHRLVLLGAATHGSQEFYAWRRWITERLIQRHGFHFIAVEGDWPDSQSINRFVLGTNEEPDPYKVLHRFYRWPTWLWANSEIARLIDGLQRHNALQFPYKKVQFYGLDLYSIYESVDSVLRFLERVNPLYAERARNRYACFERFNRDELALAQSFLHYPDDCEEELVISLQEMHQFRIEHPPGVEEEALFDAEQNARAIRDAERYYRAVMRGDAGSQRLRESHMLDTLKAVMNRHGPGSRGIIWAHNRHVGDSEASAEKELGWESLRTLLGRELGEKEIFSVGFGTHRGSVIAAPAWDAPYQVMRLPPARVGSFEELFHSYCLARGHAGLALLGNREEGESKPHRSIGVIYDPARERNSNYLRLSLTRCYDAFVYLDQTGPVEPLHVPFAYSQIPETWPTGT